MAESENLAYHMAESHVVYASRETEPLESPKQPPSSPEKVEKQVVHKVVAKEKEMIADLLSWRDPAQTGLLFGTFNIYFILRQLVSDPMHWALFLVSWLAFPLGYFAKAMIHADQKSPALDVDVDALTEGVVEELKSLRASLVALFSWESPENSLKVAGLLFLYASFLRIFGFVISFNCLLLLPLLVQHLPVDQLRSFSTNFRSFLSKRLSSIPPPQVSALLDWSKPKASVYALATANAAVVSAPVLLSYNVMAMGASLAAASLMGAFVLKELQVSDVQTSLAQEPSQECERQMKATINAGITNFLNFVHRGYELVTWKNPRTSLIAFITAIVSTSLMTVIGTAPLVLLGLNSAAILAHPAIADKIKTKVQ